jgi:hypothetical protein
MESLVCYMKSLVASRILLTYPWLLVALLYSGLDAVHATSDAEWRYRFIDVYLVFVIAFALIAVTASVLHMYSSLHQLSSSRMPYLSLCLLELVLCIIMFLGVSMVAIERPPSKNVDKSHIGWLIVILSFIALYASVIYRSKCFGRRSGSQCSRCGYEQTGLRTPVCPECGMSR